MSPTADNARCDAIPGTAFAFRVGTLLLLLTSLSCDGCAEAPVSAPFTWSTNPPTDTEATNLARRRLGLREIDPETWYFYGTKTYKDGTREESWKLTQGPQETPAKTVAYSADGEVVWEEDYYYSGGTFVSWIADGGISPEALFFHYDYGTGKGDLKYSGTDPRIIALFGGPPSIEFYSSYGIEPEPTFTELKALADKILALWGQ